MRICHVITGLGPEVGGPRQVVLGLSRGLVEAGVDVSVVATDVKVGGGRHVTPVRMDQLGGAVLRVVRHQGPWRVAYAPGLRRVLRAAAQDHDVFHIHGVWMYPTTVAASVARDTGTPYVITPHGSLNEWGMSRHSFAKRLWFATLERRAVREAAAVHFFNDEERVDAAVGSSIRRKLIIPNGIDPMAFDPLPPRGAFRHHLDVGNAPLVLFLGRLHPVKGLPLLINAFVRVKSRIPDAVLIIAGPDDRGYSQILDSQIQATGLGGSVRLVGALDHGRKVQALVDADVLAQTSLQEGQSMSLTEALYCGLPVLASRTCNVGEAAAAGAAVVTNLHEGEIGSRLAELLTNPSSRRAMGAAGRRLAVERFTWPAIVPRFVDAYRTISDRPERAAAITLAVAGPRTR